jgi:DNA end-binding protein Ku
MTTIFGRSAAAKESAIASTVPKVKSKKYFAFMRACEVQMAKQVMASMNQEWKPEQYNDEYHEALEKLIEEKIEDPDNAAAAPAKKRQAKNVLDLVPCYRKACSNRRAKREHENPSGAGKTKKPARKKVA